jgi:amino acid adenylation domain-containing protein
METHSDGHLYAFASTKKSPDRTTDARSGGPEPAPAGVADLVAAWVRRQPDALAVQEPLDGVTYTYRELWERAGRLAAELAAVGVTRGGIVAVDLPRCADLVVAFLGIVRAGAAYLPLDVQAPEARVAGIVEESGAVAVVCRPEGSRVRGLPLPLVAVPEDHIFRDGSGAPTARTVPEVTASGEDSIYVTYTSGSTGRPKGVVIPHRAVVRLVTSPNYCVMRPGERVANTCNPAFDVTTSEIWGALCSGATVVPFPQVAGLDLGEWLSLLVKEDIATMFLTTSLFHTVAWARPDAFASLRNLVVGGEQLDLAAAKRVLAAGPPVRLVNGYGPTEGTSFATYFECTEDSLDGLNRVPIGYALQQTGLQVLDDELRAVPWGQVGELCLGGPGVATGYLHRPELTAERFVVDARSGARVYRTGDLVRGLPSGALEMIGRRDRQVKLRGFRIELEEIERAAVATGLVNAAFVDRVGDDASAMLVAFVLPRGSTSPGDGDRDRMPRALSAALADRLPDYMVPGRWIVLDELPVGVTGKADRTAMLALLARRDQRASAGASDEGPANRPMFTALCGVLETVLGRHQFSPDDGFIELGGNSMLAMRIAHLLKEEMRLPLRPTDVLRSGTLGELADRMSALTQASA